MINMTKALLQSRQHARTDGQCKQRDGNSRKESKRNARGQKHGNRNEDTTEERKAELEYIAIETSKSVLWNKIKKKE